MSEMPPEIAELIGEEKAGEVGELIDKLSKHARQIESEVINISLGPLDECCDKENHRTAPKGYEDWLAIENRVMVLMTTYIASVEEMIKDVKGFDHKRGIAGVLDKNNVDKISSIVKNLATVRGIGRILKAHIYLTHTRSDVRNNADIHIDRIRSMI